MQKNRELPNILIISFCLFVTFISFFNIFLSIKAKPLIQEKLPLILKRQVIIGNISCFTLSGITITDSVIYNVTNEHPLYYFKKLKIKPSLISLIFERKLKFYCEIYPTKKFKAHIYIVGNYNFKTNDLFLKFRLKDVPYTEDLGSIYGTLHLYKKTDLKKDEYPTDLFDLTFTSQKMLFAVTSKIVTKDRKTDIIGTIHSPFMKTDKIQFSYITSDIALVGDKLYVYNLRSDIYRGILQMDGYIDLDNPVAPFAMAVNIKDVDINEFCKNSSIITKKEINGIIHANLKLKGSFGYTNSLFGKAWVEIKNANLWESTLFKGVADVLLIPDLKKVIFTDAHGSFQVQNSRIYTTNFKLASKEVEFLVKGNLAFNGLINGIVHIKFKRELIEKSTWFSKLSSLLLESTGWFLGNIKISGHFEKPDFTVTPVGVGNIFEKVKKTIDRVKDILK